jgi:N-acyl homoserine lactone hydrolase
MGTTFTIHPLKCGYIVNHEISSFVYRKNYGGRRFDAPCLAYLLRGGGQNILIDTGPGPKARVPQHYTAAETDVDDLLLAELGRLGVTPEAIRIVVLTHLHNDHVGGVSHFPDATFYVQETELREAVWPVPFQRPIYEVNQRGRRPPWVEILDRMEVLTGDSPILPGLSTLLLPGHTSGSQGVLVDTTDGPYLLPGDLVPLYDNWPVDGSPPVPNGNHTDLYAYDRSFRRLAGMDATIIPSHDPRVLDHPAYPLPNESGPYRPL